MRSLWLPSGQVREVLDNLRLHGEDVIPVSFGRKRARMRVGKLKAMRPDVQGQRRVRQLHELPASERLISVTIR